MQRPILKGLHPKAQRLFLVRRRTTRGKQIRPPANPNWVAPPCFADTVPEKMKSMEKSFSKGKTDEIVLQIL